MTDMKNSAFLDRMIEHAKSFGRSSKVTMTAERFLLSALDVALGDYSEGVDADVRAEIQRSLQKIGDSDAALLELQGRLRELFQSGQEKTSYLSGVYFQQITYEAKALARQNGLEELTAELLLQRLLENPSRSLQEYVGHPQPQPATEPDTPSGEIKSSEEPAPAELKTDETPATSQPQADGDAGETQPADPRRVVEDLTKKARTIQDKLSGVVFGQENAISVFTSGYFQSELMAATDKTRKRPAGTFLFAGPPGVGKTFLVDNIVDMLGMQEKVKRFDMSEYADPQAYLNLIGFDGNYKSPQEGLLTGFVRRNPKCILLFDEIEKANRTTIHLFLQILDEGFLTDNWAQKRVSFKDALIFFTTNAGKDLYNAPDAYDFSGTPRKVILKALQREINPYTGQPFFPAPICSRFSSGNVVMFNHMSASSLCKIVESGLRKQADNFEKEYGIKVQFDRDVYTALMFAEGGTADARSLRGRTERFFDEEIFELFRLMASGEHEGDISKLDAIHFNVELPKDKEISSLFKNNKTHNVLLFSSDDTIQTCQVSGKKINLLGVKDLDTAKQQLSQHDVGFAIIDLLYDAKSERKFMNIEDVDSAARDVFWYIREKYADMPIYILQHQNGVLSKEEQKSYLKEGVRGFITVGDKPQSFSKEVNRISEEMYQQSSMKRLASSNNLITFETGQRVSADEKTAEITLFDFELSTAVDAEDTQNIMSNVSKPNVSFDSIIGAENAKEELRFFIDYLKDPKRFAESGLRAPRGVLLYGPPGTGKTMLAKAVASEAGVTFISAEGNQFIKKYVGQGKDALHDLFAMARKYSPAILFIDEFEAIAKERRGGDHAAANGEDVLTALLTEMDGFNTDVTRPVFVLAATNFSVDPGTNRSLDPALLRRFDSKICVDLPNKEERIRFINMKRAKSPAFDISDQEVENIAVRSTGMSLADLDSIMELSLRTAIRKEDKKVTDQVLDEAFETFIGGEEKKWDPSQLERTARHEAGHTFLCWQSGETPSYVTVVARGDHGGYMLHDGNEEKQLYTKDELLARIRTALGGRAAEIVYYGDQEGVSTGASGDLASATRLARQIICAYGMDDQFGLAVVDPQAASAGELSREVREAVNAILEAEMKNAKQLIAKNRASIDALVKRLLSDNHLTGDEIKAVFEKAAST